MIAMCSMGCISPLMNATRHGSAEKVQVLLQDSKVDVNDRDKYGATVLMYAAGKASTYGKARQGFNGKFKMICEMKDDEDIEKVRLLLKRRVDVHTRDNRGWTALNWAICGGNPQIVRLLIEAGAEIEAEEGITLLMPTMLYAGKLAKMHMNVMNAKQKEIPYEKILLNLSKRYGQVAKILIENGVDPNAKNTDGHNAFAYFLAGSGEKYIMGFPKRLPDRIYENEGWSKIKISIKNLLHIK